MTDIMGWLGVCHGWYQADLRTDNSIIYLPLVIKPD